MDKEKKKFSWGNILLCAAFLFLCGVLPLAGFIVNFTGNATEDTGENRTLAAMPEVHSAADLLIFPEEFEAWYDDHLFLKSELVQLDSEVEAAVFGELDNDQVILGTQKPWMFYSADDGQPLQTYQHTNLFTSDELALIAENMKNLNSDLADAGMEFILMISPDKETIYGPDYMPSYITVNEGPSRTEQLISYMAQAAPEVTIVYPRDALLEAKQNGSPSGAGALYYESDTHWNQAGAWIGARELLNAVAAKMGISWTAPILTFSPAGTVPGDLQKIAQLGSDYDSHEYTADQSEPVEVIGTITDNSNDEVVWLRSEGKGADAMPVSLYLAGDSFRWNLRSYLQEFTRASVVSSRFYFDTEDLVAREPQIFVYQIAERYLHELPLLPGYNTMALRWPESDF